MEVNQIQCKFPKIGNGGYASTIVSQREKMDDDEDEGENRQSNPNNIPGGGAIDPGGGGVVGLYGWPSSRIVRVSRATGGKDRHSKVLTSRGLRDRRVRLSVNTAIEFYDLQDRLGYDQPSKAVEWLLAAAASSIAELPPMNSPFSLPNNRPSKEEDKPAADRRMISVVDRGGVQQGGAAKSPVGSSSSETSKGSGVSISRSEKAKANEKESEKSAYVASFTELLSGGGISYVNGGGCAERDQRPGNDENSNFVFPRFPLDYLSSGGLLVPAAAPLHLGELQPALSFSSDHLVSPINNNNNRGTLQSNSSTPPPSIHFPPNFFGGGAPPAANHRHFVPGFDPRLQLYYGNDGGPERKDKP